MSGSALPKSFGTKLLRLRDDKLIIQENPKSLPRRIGGYLALLGALVLVDYFLWIASTATSVLGGFCQFAGLVIALIGIVAAYALIQLFVFIQFPIVLDRRTRTVTRGKREHLEGRFRAQVKDVASGRSGRLYHVVLSQKGRSMFLQRVDSELEGKEMAKLVNAYLGDSLADAEVGEDAFDHVG